MRSASSLEMKSTSVVDHSGLQVNGPFDHSLNFNHHGFLETALSIMGAASPGFFHVVTIHSCIHTSSYFPVSSVLILDIYYFGALTGEISSSRKRCTGFVPSSDFYRPPQAKPYVTTILQTPLVNLDTPKTSANSLPWFSTGFIPSCSLITEAINVYSLRFCMNAVRAHQSTIVPALLIDDHRTAPTQVGQAVSESSYSQPC